MSKDQQVRRTWTREEKQIIIAEIGVDGATVPDVSKRHKIDRYLLKRWMRQLSAEPTQSEASSVFVPVIVSDPEPAAPPVCVEVGLSNGRSLTLSSELSDVQIRRFIALVEAA